MKPFVVAVTFAALLAPSASLGDAAAAIGGTVSEAATGRPLAGISVELTGRDGFPPRTVVTDKHGFFMVVGLEPDRYVATALVRAVAASCRAEEVASGQMRRLQLVVGAYPEETCAEGRPAGSLVDPDETADVYRIR